MNNQCPLHDHKQTSLSKRKYYLAQLQIYVSKCRSNTIVKTAYNYFNDADKPWTWSTFQRLFHSRPGFSKTYINNKSSNWSISSNIINTSTVHNISNHMVMSTSSINKNIINNSNNNSYSYMDATNNTNHPQVQCIAPSMLQQLN